MELASNLDKALTSLQKFHNLTVWILHKNDIRQNYIKTVLHFAKKMILYLFIMLKLIFKYLHFKILFV